MTLLRHLLSILLLPCMVVVVVPRWLLGAWRALDTRWTDGTVLTWSARAHGALVCLAGLALVAWCVTLFARVGRGTLAPWDPTRRLVVVGPYRHVRNPMIAGVAIILLGEALATGSRLLALWLATFVAVNHVYFLRVEEPGLVARFGDAYRAYRAAVPRWVPRATPWRGEPPPS